MLKKTAVLVFDGFPKKKIKDSMPFFRKKKTIFQKYLKKMLDLFSDPERPQIFKMQSTNRNWCDLEGALGVR